jgi:hypothetical protein
LSLRLYSFAMHFNAGSASITVYSLIASIYYHYMECA